MTLSFDPIDFDEFHTVDLPARIDAGNGALAAPDLAGVGTLGFRTPDGAAYTYVPSPDTVEIWAGDAAADTLVEMSRDAFSDFANELRTCFGLLYSGLAEDPRRLRLVRAVGARVARALPQAADHRSGDHGHRARSPSVVHARRLRRRDARVPRAERLPPRSRRVVRHRDRRARY
jgi:hypothetical protein